MSCPKPCSAASAKVEAGRPYSSNGRPHHGFRRGNIGIGAEQQQGEMTVGQTADQSAEAERSIENGRRNGRIDAEIEPVERQVKIDALQQAKRPEQFRHSFAVGHM
jgi:hypothetical protein